MQISRQTVELAKLYEIKEGQEEFNKSIWVNSGAIDIYASSSEKAPTLLTSMTLSTEDTAVSGTNAMSTYPKYLAFKQNTGTSTEIVLSNVYLVEVGDIV